MTDNEVENAIARRLKYLELKKEERQIIGELLVDFFEIERNLNYMLTESILDPTQSTFLDTILENTPIRYRIKAAKEFGLLSPTDASLFHKLCNERNQLAHASSKKRIVDLFPAEARKRFIKHCSELNAAITEMRSELLVNWL